MNKLPLTIVTAVLNEEKNLPAFLGQVKNFADEVIVVVDHRSTDKSAEIGRKAGCKVLLDKGESRGIVFNNKNWAAGEAKNDWVLILDADERMDEKLQKEIAQVVLGTYPKKGDIYQTSFLNYEFGKIFDKCDQKKKPFVRLFRKGTFSYQTGKTAEGFGIQTKSLAGNPFDKFILKIPLVRTWYLNRVQGIVTLHGHLVHLSHPAISDFIRKIDHYSTREAGILFESNPNITLGSIALKIAFLSYKEFMYKYFIWKLYREGIHGFIVSVIYSFYHFLIYSKYFELVYRKKNIAKINAFGKKHDFKDL